MSHSPSRRQWLRQTGQFAAAAALAASHRTATTAGAAAVASARSIRLGGPIFQPPQDPEQLALAHRQLGYRAAYCPRVELAETQRIRDLARAFDKHDIVIAEVGRWVNLLDSDPAQRRQNMERVIEGLALADEIGARCCVDIAGSYSRTHWYGPHPGNITDQFFEAAVENARQIIDAVKPKRAKFCYEMMGWALPDSPDSYLRMLQAVERPAFAVHLDPSNLVNSPDRYYRNAQLLDECFAKLGPWIVSCHAKDVAWDVELQVHFREVPLGTGGLDYSVYLRRLASLPHEAPLMMEHLKTPAEYAASQQHLQTVAQQVGVRFEAT